MAVAHRKLAPVKRVVPRKPDEPSKKVPTMKKSPWVEKPQSTRKRVKLATLKELPTVTACTGAWDEPSFNVADRHLLAANGGCQTSRAAAAGELLDTDTALCVPLTCTPVHIMLFSSPFVHRTFRYNVDQHYVAKLTLTFFEFQEENTTHPLHPAPFCKCFHRLLSRCVKEGGCICQPW